MTNRRSFLKTSGILSAGLLLNNEIFAADKKQKIGLQLYTLRKLINSKNVHEVLAKVASIGYKELEIPGFTVKDKIWGIEPKALKAILKANKLTAISAHVAFENFLTGKDELEFRICCEAAGILDHRYLVVAWLPDQYRKTADDYKLIAAKLSKAATIANQYGLQLAYHNHDFEFTELEKDQRGYDILLNNTDAKLVPMELDLYWALKAGVDPLVLFEQHPGRFPLWHVKDMDRITGGFTEVGSGSIDFQKIFLQTQQAGLKHFFIEQDEVKKDAFESVKESYEYVRNVLDDRR